MTLNTITKKLNVYTADEKLNTFFDIYRSGIDLEIDVFLNKLYGYKKYISWSEQYFKISRYFNYEQDVLNIEKFILNLPVFANQSRQVTWDKNFGIDFNQFNQTHYAMSDIGSVNLNEFDKLSFSKSMSIDNQLMLQEYQKIMPPDYPPVHSVSDLTNLPSKLKEKFAVEFINKNGVTSWLEQDRQNKINKYLPGYHSAKETIDQMIKLGIIISGPPIKKQTLQEKRKVIKNFNQCVEQYNQWIIDYPELGMPITDSDVDNQCLQEQNFWLCNNQQNQLKLN
jgi:hypothetical protein